MHDEPLRHRTTTALWGRLQSFVRWHGVNTHRATLVTGLTLILLLTITAILAGRVLYDRAIDEWRRELSNLSLILAENTSQAVNSAYLVVNDLAETVAAANIENQAAMGAVFGTEAVFQTLRSQISGLPQISVVTIVGANGNVINFSRSFPAPTISLADRDHFLHHQARRVEGVYLSVPVRNKGDGKWTFYLSRRLENADHQFLGVALVGISCDFFSDFFRNVSIGENAAISLFRRDFTLLARWPVVEEKLGKKLLTGSTYDVITQGKEHDVILKDGPREVENLRHVFRMTAVRQLKKYPLIVNVTVTDEVFLGGWRQMMRLLGGITVVSVLALAIAFALMARLLKRHEADTFKALTFQAEAEAANQAKSSFLAMMSHEIRTPMNGTWACPSCCSNRT